MTPQEKLYTIAKGNLGIHCTLNDTVPHEKGCAEALSYNLKQAGFSIPPAGIAGTAALVEFLKRDPEFQQVNIPEAGDILAFPTGSGNGTVEGHVFICGNSGLMSNDSATGLWLERWTLQRAHAYYQQAGGLAMYVFRAISV